MFVGGVWEVCVWHVHMCTCVPACSNYTCILGWMGCTKICLDVTALRKVKGVQHLWAVFLKILCLFSKHKADLGKVSYGSGQKCYKEL